ncbi:hypothetical protein [Photobacterium damselae]|uniref:hypothetical protein n=1 Tax=Photobacterium damselae TaxID=38293 RepID=UPI001F3C4ECE|nr:hypothetical protein [Photobacterium damselae]UKA12917.1 hypothetical protein IHC91_21605 [Photobacterium damselae subsp. damselae]
MDFKNIAKNIVSYWKGLKVNKKTIKRNLKIFVNSDIREKIVSVVIVSLYLSLMVINIRLGEYLAAGLILLGVLCVLICMGRRMTMGHLFNLTFKRHMDHLDRLKASLLKDIEKETAKNETS